ncbi:MAG TPA: ATP-binding protein, partial [Tepidisphaeraceae bacterium]|nr:ATP-binding protein [Tepidisphaeraceae bacterium]
AEEIAAAFNLEETSGSIVALAAAPIATASQVYGWLCFGEKLGSDEFTEEDEQIAITLGAQLGLAYENALRLQSIRRHANELEDRIRDRTVELHRSNQALEQFASTAAHDLQAPLNTVIGYMQQLRKQRAKPFDADTSESMEAVFTAAKRMQQFVRDALDYSRLGGANAPLHSTESSSAMERALDNLAADISANGASIICEQLPTVNADESQLTQLFQNLIHNAMKFCNRAKPCIHVWAESAGNKWVFAVKDNGIGIAPADFERVFNLFTRLNGRDEYSGSGIGLAVCKKIIARHGGRIWIESAVGEGTTIHFTLTASTDVETPMRMPIQSELHEENLELARG